MRAGGCTVQQALTAEAAGVVKQAVALARRRGHAQVTPLHVANTMLSTSTGLLRTACLQSRSHPLQCRALELCFNVALNRLPASTGSPMMGSHHHHQHHPSISNALVAAFKRAQAHQRRGSVENQQQPLLAVKIELEQLIISILDDPSVSRVMREAGFSSTQVKINVEQAVSLEICNNNVNDTSDPAKNDDVMFVMENMVKKTKSTVIVGENLSHVEGVARGVMDKIEKGAKCVNLTIASFARLTRDEVEWRVEELERVVKSYLTSGGAVLFLGDLKWTAEYRSSTGSTDRRINHYCPVEHMVIEIGKLMTRIGEHDRFWLIGIATFETYKICKSGHFSLESVLGLNLITIPSNSLRLSLVPVPDSDRYSSKKGENGCGWLQVELGGQNGNVEVEKELNCCSECSANFESEARSLRSRASSGCHSPNAHEQSNSSNLPAWLQQYKNQNKPSTTSIDQECVTIKDLGKKWSSICRSIHKHHHRHDHDHHQQQYSSEKTLNFSSIISPSSTSTSNFSYNPYPALHRNMSWPQHNHHHNFSAAAPETVVNLSPNSASSSDVMEVDTYVARFKELNADNLKTLCGALERAAPYHAHLAPDVAAAILRCRSGMARRVEKHDYPKEDTWLLFRGGDVAAKEAVARELARVVFGSHASHVSVPLSSFSPSDRDRGNKRSRDDRMERFAEAVAENPHRVFFVEDVEEADWRSRVGFRRAVESGQVAGSSLGDAIVILSCCERFRSRSRAGSPTSSDREKSPCLSLDLNMSIDGDGVEECEFDRSGDEIGLVEAVDAVVNFKFQDL